MISFGHHGVIIDSTDPAGLVTALATSEEGINKSRTAGILDIVTGWHALRALWEISHSTSSNTLTVDDKGEEMVRVAWIRPDSRLVLKVIQLRENGLVPIGPSMVTSRSNPPIFLSVFLIWTSGLSQSELQSTNCPLQFTRLGIVICLVRSNIVHRYLYIRIITLEPPYAIVSDIVPSKRSCGMEFKLDRTPSSFPFSEPVHNLRDDRFGASSLKSDCLQSRKSTNFREEGIGEDLRYICPGKSQNLEVRESGYPRHQTFREQDELDVEVYRIDAS